MAYTPEVEKVIAELKAIDEEMSAAIKRRSETQNEMERSITEGEIERLRQKLFAVRRILLDKP